MKISKNLAIIVLAAMVGISNLSAQTGSQNGVHGAGFVDENGDGYNDNAPDHDGDGIPNRLDPDYVPIDPDQTKGRGFIDEDGDGINDRYQDADGDGIQNCLDPDWVKPEDGTGYQFGKSGQENGRQGFGNRGTGSTGDCDLTGPKGMKNGKSGK